MKIAQSSVNLVSSHKYYEENSVTVQSGVMTRSSFLDSLQNQSDKMSQQTTSVNQNKDRTYINQDTVNSDESPIDSGTYNSLRPYKTEYLNSYTSSLEEQLSQIRASLLESLLSFLQIIGGDRSRSGYRDMIRQTSNMLTSQSFVKVTTVQISHVEEESTTFSGKGVARTEDGRSIDFNVDFSMSRKLCEYAGVSIASAVSLIDPLVINVGNDVTHVSDQSFYFDLDCDGEEDKIAKLTEGSGFLTYDRNGDGIINNGSELFGTKSGNGFKDLAEFDSDNNGWIDENDEIYGKLRVWLRNEDGTDTLLTLKEADVGAIYLDSAETQYSQYAAASENPALAAMMRSSGIFLKESGGVGTVHQLDLARL